MTLSDLTLTPSAPFKGLPAPTASEPAPAVADHLGRDVQAAVAHPLYAVLDAAKTPFLAERIAREDLQARMIYRGHALQDMTQNDPMAEVSPWLIALPENSMLRAEMLGADPDTPWHLMHKTAGIFLRSDAQFDALLHHLRGITQPRDEGGIAGIFRFQEPAMLWGALVGLPTGAVATMTELIDAVIWAEATVEHGLWRTQTLVATPQAKDTPKAPVVFDAQVRTALTHVTNLRRARAVLRDEAQMPVAERLRKEWPLAVLMGQSQSSPAAMLHHLRLLDMAPPHEQAHWQREVAAKRRSLPYINRDMHAAYGTGAFVK